MPVHEKLHEMKKKSKIYKLFPLNTFFHTSLIVHVHGVPVKINLCGSSRNREEDILKYITSR